MNNSQTKSIEHYLGLRYPISVRELKPEEGGGFLACIPQLGRKTFMAVGETLQEAMQSLEELRHELIPVLVADGIALPEPAEEDESLEGYSGSVMLRLPKILHAQLARQAKKNSVSINKLATHYLTEGVAGRDMAAEIRADLRRETREYLAEIRQEVHPS